MRLSVISNPFTMPAAMFASLAFLLPCCGGKTTTVPWTPKITVTGISPAYSGTNVATPVTIFGVEFQAGATVVIGGNLVPSPNVVSATQIACTAPSVTTTGFADVTVTNPDGKSATLAGGFEYDGVAPPAVTNFQASSGSGQVTLTWTNPASADWKGVMIRRGAWDYPMTASDGALVYSGTNQNCTDAGLTNGVRYYYSAFSYDRIPNYSAAANAEGLPTTPPTLANAHAIFESQAIGGQVLFRAHATDSDGTVDLVEIDLSAIGGSATQQMYDNGAYGDQIPGDEVFSWLATVEQGTTLGAKNLPITAWDDAGSSATASASLNVNEFLLDFANKRVNTNSPGVSDAASPAIACNGGLVYAAWVDTRNGDSDVFFNQSFDGGSEWGSYDRRLDGGGTALVVGNVRLISTGYSLFAVWQDLRNGLGNADIMFRPSPALGFVWGAERRLDSQGASNTPSTKPQMAFSGSRIYVVWQDRRGGTYEDIYFNCSDDWGSTWLPADIRLDDNASSSNSTNPVIACSGNSVYVAWMDNRNAGGNDVYMNRSNTGGTGWAIDRRVSASSTVAGGPQIACSEQSVYVVWSDTRNAGKTDIYFNKSVDGGWTWPGTDVKIDHDAANPSDSTTPVIACSGHDVYVAWSDKRNGNADILFNESSDSGANWMSSDVRLDCDAAGSSASSDPVIACSGNNVYVGWEDGRNGSPNTEHFFNYSLDTGSTWLSTDIRIQSFYPGAADAKNLMMTCEGNDVYFIWNDDRYTTNDIWFQHGRVKWNPQAGMSDVRVDNDTATNVPTDHQIACSGNNVYLVWAEDRSGSSNKDIYFNVSHDGGSAWQTFDMRLDKDTAGANNSVKPKIACSGDCVCVVWEDSRSGGAIYSARSANGGSSWSGETMLSMAGMNSRTPDIACSGQNVYVVWSTGNDIDFRYSLTGGAGWMPATSTTISSGTAGVGAASNPKVACAGEAIYVTWQDDRLGTGLHDIYFNSSLDWGSTWGSPDVRVDQDTANNHSQKPQIACDGCVVAVVWEDRRNVTWDIYMNMSTASGMAGTWSSESRVETDSPGAANSTKPQLYYRGSFSCGAWEDDRNSGPDVFFKSGGGFQQPPSDVQIDGDSSYAFSSSDPALAVCGSILFVSWLDFRNGPSNGAIYCTHSADAGITWASTQTRLDSAATASVISPPRIAHNGDDFFVAWIDSRNGNGDLFFNSVK